MALFSPERKAVWVATFTAAGLVTAKAVVGFMTGSMAVLASAADSFLDLCVSFANLWALRVAERPANSTHPYGHGKMEGFAALGEGLVVAFSGGWIAWEASKRLINQQFSAPSGWPLVVMIISLIVTYFLVRYLRRMGKKTGSLILQADALHYQTDLLSNAGILVALILVWALKLPLIDPLVSLFVAVYIIWGGIGVVRNGRDMLMDMAIEPIYVEAVLQAIAAQPEIAGHHFLKTRRSGKNRFVEVHIVFHNPYLPLFTAHEIGDRVEDAIEAAVPGAIVTLHLDPCDDSPGKGCVLPNQNQIPSDPTRL